MSRPGPFNSNAMSCIYFLISSSYSSIKNSELKTEVVAESQYCQYHFLGLDGYPMSRLRVAITTITT